ncbi:hypothetical protein TTHERM_002653336, partial (macronuclear) [Tetrahymena thermophila SB210]
KISLNYLIYFDLNFKTDLNSQQIALFNLKRNNKIGDKGAQNIGLGLSNCTQLRNLIFCSDNNEEFLKSREIINCKNIKLLNI